MVELIKADRDLQSIGFIALFILCLQKRGKAIKYSGATLAWNPVTEFEDGFESEIPRLDVHISYEVAARRVHLTVQVWGDRWVWMDV